MERFSTCELRDKEVVNMCDGTRLGCPSDFEFSVCDGRITALIVPKMSGMFGIGREEDIVIPWCKIEYIGLDAILVKISPEEYSDCRKDKKKRKNFW